MLKKLSLSVMTFTYLFAGLAHFVRRDYFIALTPPFIHSAGAFVLLSGTLYMGLGILLLFEKTQRAACYAILLILALGIPLTLYMISSETARGSISLGILVGRIPFKILLLVWAWWHTRKTPKSSDIDHKSFFPSRTSL